MTFKQLVALGAIGVSLVLAGGPAMADEDPASDECGASALQDRIGEPVTGTTADDLHVGGERVTTAKTVRVVKEGQPMTMDHRVDRLTIQIDEEGNLVSATCV